MESVVVTAHLIRVGVRVKSTEVCIDMAAIEPHGSHGLSPLCVDVSKTYPCEW